MTILTWVIIGSTAWFLILAVIRRQVKWKFCAACVAVTSTWVALLILRLIGFSISPLLIGVLMGETVVGLYFLLERKSLKIWPLFRWPYLMTATALGYLLISGEGRINTATAGALLALWFIFGSIYLLRSQRGVRKIAERLVACCRDW